ncbi:hypothetical protein A2970_02610 [Candidatus Roizmanbacteria bacterium RIFCSPLOWO2_01_FULL_44_13]|uniref:Nucleoid-associated protein, YbaB/EbfC family n=1 Tax=Candidatus Roizmanbacteria bacterium RIFCSPLOWO2_01_FULL_44_13 TaxID=1802069 RepID=A0A1F7J949_9BACT|nr:MAG: hypothetical protein A2970_02610 [Candidatus Roizmanbacteria bacterium RIFCSPLOWO2_01_FULL_44_13]
MFNPLSGLGDLQKLQQQAKLMQEALQKETVEVEKNGVKVTVRGDQVIMSIEVDGIIENRVAEAVNEAIKKTQELAARKLIEISSQQPNA